MRTKLLSAMLVMIALAAHGQPSLYVDTPIPNSHPLKKELIEKLKQSGKVKIVTLQEKADLILSLEQTGRGVSSCSTGLSGVIFSGACGNRGRAVLKSRYSGEELWSEEKGGGWQWSGWSAAMVGRKLGNDLSKFLTEQPPATLSSKQADSAGAPSNATIVALGIVVRISEEPDVQGVQILDVNDDGPAKAAGLRTGYVITAIDGKHVKTIGDLQDELKSRAANTSMRVGYMFHTNLGWMGNAAMATLGPGDPHK